eukprot:TRINITY_DN66933_c0_g1_i1.p2 TRINITY_DN66933_c0_g1~~TRINITY_DN66933_c0_g1_i1.p2  ORF type:complete len:107 (+),score=7.44 TRINITY_DN66933_c0_g1_i1:117-437(+)
MRKAAFPVQEKVKTVQDWRALSKQLQNKALSMQALPQTVLRLTQTLPLPPVFQRSPAGRFPHPQHIRFRRRKLSNVTSRRRQRTRGLRPPYLHDLIQLSVQLAKGN